LVCLLTRESEDGIIELMRVLGRGFTLIELLVTIGVLAVVAAGVIAAIDPLDKMRQARDAGVQSDISSVATALNTYAASNGAFPVAANWAALGTGLATELSAMPVAGTGYTYGGVTSATDAVVYGNLLSKKYTGTSTSKCPAVAAYWMWTKTSSGGSGDACGFCGAAVPTSASACSFTP